MTIIAHFFLISYTIPANLHAFIKTLFPLITLDFLHLTVLLDPIFKFSELDLEPLSYNCEAVGYEDALLLPNLAEKFYLIFFMPLILLMIALGPRLWKLLKCKEMHRYSQGQKE